MRPLVLGVSSISGDRPIRLDGAAEKLAKVKSVPVFGRCSGIKPPACSELLYSHPREALNDNRSCSEVVVAPAQDSGVGDDLKGDDTHGPERHPGSPCGNAQWKGSVTLMMLTSIA